MKLMANLIQMKSKCSTVKHQRRNYSEKLCRDKSLENTKDKPKEIKEEQEDLTYV